MLRTIKAKYTIGIIAFITILVTVTVAGIKVWVTPSLIDAGEQAVIGRVNGVSNNIYKELNQVQAQQRSVTQSVTRVSSDVIDKLLPGLIDQYGDAKVFGGGIWPLPNERETGKTKFSTFYHRDKDGKLTLNTHWNSPESLNYWEQPWFLTGLKAPLGTCAWAAAYKDAASSEPRTNCAMAIYREGQAYGVATIDLTLGFFNPLVSDLRRNID